MTLANQLTLLRILLIPLLVLVFYLLFDWRPISVCRFFIGGNHRLVGWLRVTTISRHLWCILDPVADKLMVAVALVLL